MRKTMEKRQLAVVYDEKEGEEKEDSRGRKGNVQVNKSLVREARLAITSSRGTFLSKVR
jgi:hypothetical protein